MSIDTPDLIVPVYLNQRMVFDLVAMLQGGIATVTRVSEAQRDSESEAAEVAGGFGLSQALSSLLRVNLSGKLSGRSEGSVERSTSSERVHTPASLFYTLRNLLLDSKVLRVRTTDSLPQPGEIVEFTAALKRNPFIEGLDAVIQILDLVIAVSETEIPQKSGKRTQVPNEQERLRTQLDSLLTSLRTGGTGDLVADLRPGDGRALLTVEDRFLNDPSLSDLVDGQFRVIGKVIRSVPDASGSISLLRKTAISRVPSGVLQKLMGVFTGLEQEHGFTMPSMEVDVKGPVFQVLPLAIFT